MRRAPLLIALTLALAPAVHAEDLLQTYQLAREGDPQLAAAEAGNRATREGAVQARALRLPQVNGSAGLDRQQGWSDSERKLNGQWISTEGSSYSTGLQVGVGASQVLFDRSLDARIRAQDAQARASDFTLKSAGDALITRTAQAYFNVLVAQETLSAAEAAEAALKKQFDFADKRLEVGLAPITDVHEARARYDAARANTILVRNALVDALQALTELTGKPIRTLNALPADFKPGAYGNTDADGWVATALQNNPALQAQAMQVESAEAGIAGARAGYLPTVGLSGRVGLGRTHGGSDDNLATAGSDYRTTNRNATVGVELRVPIFNGGAIASQVRQAVAQRDGAQERLEQQRRALERSTRGAYNAMLAGVSEVEARRLALVSAQSAYDASQVGLEVGTRTVLDVLNNQQILFNAQREYALARYNYLQTRLNLEYAAGSLDIADVQDVNRLLTVPVTPAVRN